MRKLFFILMMFAYTGVFAQDNEETIVQYCLVMHTAKAEAVVLDMHSNKTYFIVDDSDNHTVFMTTIALFNYMAEHGWNYVEYSKQKLFFNSDLPVILFKKTGKKNCEWFKDIKLKFYQEI